MSYEPHTLNTITHGWLAGPLRHHPSGFRFESDWFNVFFKLKKILPGEILPNFAEKWN